MKRYLAFYGNVYYPSEGMGDFIGAFSTITESIEAIVNKSNLSGYDKDEKWDYGYGQVWDSETEQIQWEI